MNDSADADAAPRRIAGGARASRRQAIAGVGPLTGDFSETGDLDSSQRRIEGSYPTPRAVARFIVQRTLQPLLDQPRSRPLRILEPACGDGIFLEEAARLLLAHRGSRRERGRGRTAGSGAVERSVPRAADFRADVRGDDWLRIVLDSCFGVDINPVLVDAARDRLAAGGAGQDERETAGRRRQLAANILRGDALLGTDAGLPPDPEGQYAPPIDWQRAFPQVFRGGSDDGFDAVIGNPPYVNVRVLSRAARPGFKDYLRRRFACARGAFDLYVLFLERAYELLRPGGRCGMIVPNKLATLDYAKSCRSLLLERTTLEWIVDLSSCRVFRDANVYPYIVIWKKEPAGSHHAVRSLKFEAHEQLDDPLAVRCVLQRQMSAAAGLQLNESLAVEERVPTRPLGELARLQSGTTGFSARRMAEQLREYPSGGGVAGRPFIVSGCVDRYRIRLGDVQFMGHRFRRPILPESATGLSEAKRALYAGPKIVLAGMTRRLEAAWDAQGLALGVQVYAVVGGDPPAYLLGLLNSRLMSFLFSARNPAKRLGGGFLAINASQLARLPIRWIDADSSVADFGLHGAIVREVGRIGELVASEPLRCSPSDVSEPVAPPQADGRRAAALERIDRRIDQLVYRLYRLTAAEIARVEASIPPDRYSRRSQ